MDLAGTVPASASPTAGGVLPSETAHFVDHGGPILHTAQIHLLYWGGHWPATGIYFPTTTQITAALQTLLVGPYLNGLAQYRHIQPAVLRSSTIVTTSNPHNGFDDHDIAAFLNTQFDAGVVPGPDPDNQSLYLVVLPVGISASGYRYELPRATRATCFPATCSQAPACGSPTPASCPFRSSAPGPRS
jgi:hypothetical protein